MTGARCTIVWDWGDYRELFDDDTEWISPSVLAEWERTNRLVDYHRIEHIGADDGGSSQNRRLPTSHRGVVLKSNYFFSATGEPALNTRKGERQVLPWLPRPAARVWAEVDNFRRANFARPTAGIHMRRTDHFVATERAPDKAYRKMTDRLVDEGYLLFLAADNANTIEMMRGLYGARVLLHPKKSAMPERWPRPATQLADVLDDMADLWLLAVCDFVIGSADSSFSRIATFLNGSPRCRWIDQWPRGSRLSRWLPRSFHWGVTTIAANPEQIFGLPPGMVSAGLAHDNGVDAELQSEFEKLLTEVEPALTTKPVSVIDKGAAFISANAHDYVSFAPYYWPDPARPDGMPYIRKDGEINPEIYTEKADRLRIERMSYDSLAMSVCYRLTRDERYAQRAALQLRTWFIDPETSMSPHLEFSQVIPGHSSGRSFGIIDGYYLLPAMDAAAVLAGTRWWRPEDQRGLVEWVEKYLTWLRTSAKGQTEAAAKNNHGTIYDLQVVHLALVAGHRELARRVVREARTKRIAHQIRPDGSQPLEEARAESLRYPQYHLRALCRLAICAEHMGIDLWHYRIREGAGIRKAIDYLLLQRKRRERATLEREDPGFGWVLRQAERVYKDERYCEARRQLPLVFPTVSNLFGI